MSDIPVFDLLGDEIGATDETTAKAASVIAGVLGPGSTVQAARIANALRDTGALAGTTPELPAPDMHEDEGGSVQVPYWITPSGTVSAHSDHDMVVLEQYGTVLEMAIAIAEDNAHALLAAVQHLRDNPSK